MRVRVFERSRSTEGARPFSRYHPSVPERAALYRRYRPQTFSAIVGQEHVTRTLRNAIAQGQAAHAYLLAGVRGTGKTSIARLIAKAGNCPNAKDGEPCARCENCGAIREGRFLDLIELDMVIAFADGPITLAEVNELLGASDWEETAALFDALVSADAGAGVGLVGRLVDDGRDLRLFVRRAIDHARALVLTRATGRPPETVSEQVAAKLRSQAQSLSLDQLAKIAKRLVEAEQFLRTTEGTPLPLELAILDLATTQEKAVPPPDAPKREPPGPSARPAASATRSEPARRDPPRGAVVSIADRRSAPDSAAAGARAPVVALDDVRRAWGGLVTRAKERSVGKAAEVATAEPIAIEGTMIVIGFGDDFARALWQDKGRLQLEQDLSEILNAGIRVKCVKQPGAHASDDPMLRALHDTIGRPGRIMEIE